MLPSISYRHIEGHFGPSVIKGELSDNVLFQYNDTDYIMIWQGKGCICLLDGEDNQYHIMYFGKDTSYPTVAGTSHKAFPKGTVLCMEQT